MLPLLLIALAQATARTHTDMFSSVMCSIGDLDGDGVADLLISDPVDGSRTACRGRVWALSGASLSVIHTWVGEPLEFLGTTLAALGDVDADGVPDLLIAGGRDEATDRAKDRVYSGKTGEPLYTFQVMPHEYGAWSSQALALIPDINGDGVPDFVIGSTLDYERRLAYRCSRGGEVVARSGRDGKELWRHVELQVEPWLGTSIATIGDHDGDGLADLAVAAGPPLFASGYVAILSSKDGKELSRIGAPADAMRFGCAVTNGGDLDGDGTDDLLITESVEHRRVTGYSGLTGLPFRIWEITGTDSFYGTQTVVLPDLNGDGVGDLLFTSPQTLGPESAFEIRSGLDSATLWRQACPTRLCSAFSCSVAVIPDRDCDGFDDLIVGEATWRDRSSQGVARLYSARTGQPLGEITRASVMPRTEAKSE